MKEMTLTVILRSDDKRALRDMLWEVAEQIFTDQLPEDDQVSVMHGSLSYEDGDKATWTTVCEVTSHIDLPYRDQCPRW